MANKLDQGFTKADSRNLPAVSTTMVYSFITNDERFNLPETKGAKSERSSKESYGDSAIGYVCLKRNSKGFCTVKAMVCPEHKNRDKSYPVIVIVNENEQNVHDMECFGCKAAKGGCKHAFALLSWLNRRYEEPSCTDVVCYWKKSILSGVGTKLKFILASDMVKTSKPTKPQNLPDKDVFFADIVDHLDKNQVDTQLSRYSFQLIERRTYNLSIHRLLLLYFSKEQHRSADGFLDFCKSQLDPILCHEVEEQTQSQSESLLWFEVRCGRMTASKLHEAARCKTSDGSLVKQVIGASKVYDNRHMRRGRLLEHQVFDELCRMGHTLAKSGFHIWNQCPIIGASPDGIGTDYTLEIKCPTSEETFKNYVQDGKITNKYKGQMMLQMLVCNKKKGLFCVADWNFEQNHKIHQYWIDYDEKFTHDLVGQATTFWKNNIYPILTKYF
ncbi:hypothetical protein QAD02_019541 [Eretmocerus hayati]|uniref:Uncharacterized protein n=2 Tax=Eretmocerus hayati TaxID=131215 RepID=A0ACC2PME3_9HYME|nr:hypothetical protein QAD02_010689 [Eretmocerus hayati]KAJ8683749.1 hypothetical protein QAD02_019541 [Eretmocerus hayati]